MNDIQSTPILFLNLAQRWQLEKSQFKSRWFMIILAIQTFLLLFGVVGAVVPLTMIDLAEADAETIKQTVQQVADGLGGISMVGLVLSCWVLEQARYWTVGTYRRWLCDGVSRADLLAQMLFSGMLRLLIGVVLVFVMAAGFLIYEGHDYLPLVFSKLDPMMLVYLAAEFWAKMLLYMTLVLWVPRYFAPGLLYVLIIVEALVGFLDQTSLKLSQYLPYKLLDGVRDPIEMGLDHTAVIAVVLFGLAFAAWHRLRTVEL